MSRLTLILVPDETTDHVRRFRVDRRWIGRGAIAAGVVLLLGGGMFIDYVRLRLQAVEVEKLRAESVRHQEALEALDTQVVTLEEEFRRLREFERKVRVIANLPSAILEAEVPEEVRAAQGGGDEEASSDAAPGAEAPQDAASTPPPRGPAGGGDSGDGSSAAAPARATSGHLPLDAAALARIRERARRLGRGLEVRTPSFETLIRELEGKRDRLASTPSIWPTEGWVTSHYGHRTSPFTGRRQFHGGLDIASDFGTPILAPARGRVVWAGRKGPLGKAVVLDHGHGIRTIYGHTAEIFVERGETVERGARIAAVGSSGRSTGPHLHYAVSVDGQSVDPADYIFE